jgi:hypothetical protein
MRLLGISLVMVGLLVSAACGKDDNPTSPTPAPTGPVISLTGNLAFGNVTVGSTATATLTIANTGTGPLTVSGVAYPAGFTGDFTSGSIAAGASQAVTVTFTPTSGAAFTGNITVTGNQVSGTNTIAVTGNGGVATTFTLSGTVTESAPTLSTVLGGVTIRILDGANAGKSAVSSPDGRYEITGVVNGGYTITATLAGYANASLPIGIDGNTTFNFRLDPLAARTKFGPGQYRVNTDMPAGLYYSDPGHGCRFQRLRGFGGTSADVISITQVNFDANQWVVQLLGTDAGFETDASCSFWYTTPRRGLEADITPGSWVVGVQVAAGTYQAANAAVGCEWQRLSAFTGSPEAVIASAFVGTAGAQFVTIASTDAGFSTTAECGTWTRSVK